MRNDVTEWGRRLSGILGIILLAIGPYLVLVGDTAGAGLVMGFGFLLVFLFFISKFRKFKGFGIQAEMWEETQKEAEKLVSDLRSVSSDLAEELVSISIPVGHQSGLISVERKKSVFDTVERVLRTTERDRAAIDRILSPLAKDILELADEWCGRHLKQRIPDDLSEIRLLRDYVRDNKELDQNKKAEVLYSIDVVIEIRENYYHLIK